MLKQLSSLARMYLISGRQAQTFLDAAWLVWLFNRMPEPYRKGLALNLLALSPHYFYRSEANKALGWRRFLLSELQRNWHSRHRLFHHLVQANLPPKAVVMDYGCGPGFLARLTARKAGKVYALDISRGVLLCARSLNPAPNLEYLNVFAKEADRIPDGTVDLIYSFAVLQHVSGDLVEGIFELFARTLKPGGCALLQVQLPQSGWKTEQEWRADPSPRARLKYRYGLNCFAASEDFYRGKLERCGLKVVTVEPLSRRLPYAFDDLYHQHLITAVK